MQYIIALSAFYICLILPMDYGVGGGGGGGGVHTEFPGVVFGIRTCIMYSYGSLLYVSGCSHAVRMVQLRCHHNCLGVISALQMSLNVRVCSPCCPEGIHAI